MTSPFRPTHLVPDGGLPAWAEPDPSLPESARLDARLEVAVVERRGDWARVEAANGWWGWVDGSLPVALSAPPASFPGTSAAPASSAPNGLDNLMDQVSRNAVLAGVVAVGLSALTSVVLWPLLGRPARLVGSLTPKGNCSNGQPGTTSMWLCSARVGLLNIAGPIVIVVAGVVFRRPLIAGVSSLTRRLPTSSHFMIGPVMSSGMFTMAYAEIHRHTAAQTGLVSQRVFPAVVGLFVFLMSRLGPAVAKRSEGLLASRDRVPVPLRLLMALAVPVAAAYLLNKQSRVSMSAGKEQTVIILALLTSAIAIIPRSGDFRDARLNLALSSMRGGPAGFSGAVGQMLGRLPLGGGTERPIASPIQSSVPGMTAQHAPGPWRRTHVAPADGLLAWDQPDPDATPAAELQAGVELELVQTWGVWAEVRAANDWQGWVDGRRLIPMPAGDA